MDKAGVQFGRLSQKFFGDGKVTKRAYFPRQLVFQGMGEAQQKAVIKNSDMPSNIKKSRSIFLLYGLGIPKRYTN